ncbi:hypothetical protein HDU80_003114, partial [Chytriomyces hyalinus]
TSKPDRQMKLVLALMAANSLASSAVARPAGETLGKDQCPQGWTWDGNQCNLSNAGDGVRCWNGSKAASADACPKDDIVECGKAGGVWAPSGGCSFASSIKPPGAGDASAGITVSPTYLPVSRTGVSTKTDGSLYKSSAFTQIPGIMVAVSMLLAIF